MPARMKNVDAAYTPLNHHGHNGSKWSRLLASVAIATFLILFITSGSENKSANDDNLRSGQAHHATKILEQPAPVDANVESPIDIAIEEEEEIEDAVEEATVDIVAAEEEQIEETEKELEAATDAVMGTVVESVGKLFGGLLSESEINDFTQEVETELKSETINEFEYGANKITDNELDEMNTLVRTDQQYGYNTKYIEDDVYSKEKQAIESVKDDIDALGLRLRQSVQTRATEIEKQLLEEHLSQKLGKTVKLVFEDDGQIDIPDEIKTSITSSSSAIGIPQSPPVAAVANPFDYDDSNNSFDENSYYEESSTRSYNRVPSSSSSLSYSNSFGGFDAPAQEESSSYDESRYYQETTSSMYDGSSTTLSTKIQSPGTTVEQEMYGYEPEQISNSIMMKTAYDPELDQVEEVIQESVYDPETDDMEITYQEENDEEEDDEYDVYEDEEVYEREEVEEEESTSKSGGWW